MRRPLIIGHEDTPEGADALALGAQLAHAFNANPVVVRAVPVPESALNAPESTEALKAVAAEELKEPVARLEDPGAAAEAAASTSAARALHELAEGRNAIAIVVGSSDRGVLGRIVPGSTAERLLHGAPCAVGVAARGYAAEGTRPLRLAAAYDGSEEAEQAVRAGVALARRCNSSLTLFTVVGNAGSDGYPGDPLVDSRVPGMDTRTRQERRARELLDDRVGVVPADLPVHARLLHGAPGQALVDVSEDFDLILVGSRGYGPLRRTFLGSTSRRLFNGSHCSVLALPRGIDADVLGEKADSLAAR